MNMFIERKFHRPTDCVAFGINESLNNVLAVGCYELNPSTNEREGNICLLRFSVDRQDLNLLLDYSLPGVLDLQWCPQEGSYLLAAATADGNLRIYNIESLMNQAQGSSTLNTTMMHSEMQKISDGITLSADWTYDSSEILASTSDGYISRIKQKQDGLSLEDKIKAHDLEVWCIASDKQNVDLHFSIVLYSLKCDIVFSGSDDCQFKGWDLRTSSSGKPIFCKRNEHTAGVCTIAQDPQNKVSLATGSYDEYLRFWDFRNLSNPLTTHRMSCGGGVWKIKFHPEKQGYLATACMHDGFKLILQTNPSELEIVQEYKAHGSLAYGLDWYKGASNYDILATCSFYDALLHIWNSSRTL